jgi:hypothetical protein
LFRVFDEVRLPVFRIVESDADSSVTPAVERRRVVFQLALRDLDGDFSFESFEAAGDALFSLRRSPSDGLWRLVRWDDLSNQ